MPSDTEFLEYSDGLLTRCEAALRRRWHRGTEIALTRKPKGVQRLPSFFCFLDLKHPDALLERKFNDPHLPVLPFRPLTASTTVYFGVRFRFDHQYETAYGLTSASISFFSGVDLQPIARAEWDRRDIGQSRHAQPHWHLLGTDREAFGRSQGIATLEEPANFVPGGFVRVGVERIHFPASAPWQAGLPTQVQHPFLKDAHLVDWLDGMGGYMEDQFQLLLAKAGPSASTTGPRTVEASDFVPDGRS